MKKIALFAFLFSLVPSLAFAQEPTDPGNFFSQALEAIASKNWFLLSSIGVFALVFVLRKFVFKSDTGFFTTKVGGYVMNGSLSLLGAFGIALAGHGGETFTGAVIGAALLAAVKSGAFAAVIYTVLQDTLGLSSKPAV